MALLGVTMGASCLGATQITLDVRTDLDCTSARDWHGIAISVGQPGVDVDGRAPVLTTTTCSASGEVGTLVIVPTGAETAEVGIKVVAGITRNPEDCSANGYDGCIVARRTLTYLPHQSQQVVVDLTNDCLGNACDAYHTCVNGTCSDSASVTMPLTVDSGATSAPTVRCGDDGTTCPANDPTTACCVALDRATGTGKGTCVAPHDCPATSAAFYCDDSSDCATGSVDGGGGAGGATLVCCENASGNVEQTATGSQCIAESLCQSGGGVTGNALCEERRPCPVTGSPCYASYDAPGYYECYVQ